MVKRVFIGHPISGDEEGNTRLVIAICRVIHSQDVIPVFPSFTWRQYLGGSEEDKSLARQVNEEYFKSGFINELWLYGDRISTGMKDEIKLALKYRVPIVAKTESTKKELEQILGQLLGELDWRRLTKKKEKCYELMRPYSWWKFSAPVCPPRSVIAKIKGKESVGSVHWENLFWSGRVASAMFYRTRLATPEEQRVFDDDVITHLLPGSCRPSRGWLQRIPYSVRTKEKPSP